MISLRVRIHGGGHRFRQLAQSSAPVSRHELTNDLMQSASKDIVSSTPVRTGRAQRGWQRAFDGGGGEGESAAIEDSGRSTRRATNMVPYVPFLEYGTRRMAPRYIVRRALERIRTLAATLFSLHGAQQHGGVEPDETPFV